MLRLNTSDETIARRIRQGDRHAWGLLIARYLAGARALAFGQLGNRSDAETTAVAAVVTIASTQDPDAFASRLMRTVRDLARQPNALHAVENSSGVPRDAMLTPETRELHIRLRQTVLGLDQDLRDAVLLHVGGKLSRRDTAGALEIEPAELERRLSSATANCEPALLQHLPDALATTSESNNSLAALFETLGIEAESLAALKPRDWKAPARRIVVGFAVLAVAVVAALLQGMRPLSGWHADAPSSSAVAEETRESPASQPPVRAYERPAGPVSVRGQILDAATGAPVRAFALAFANESEPEANYVDLTDADGRFSLSQLPSGNSTLSIRAAGYAESKRDVTIPPAQTAPVDVAVRLEPEAVLEGEVHDAEGRPVVDAAVYLGAANELPTQESARTDANGRFTLYALPSGLLQLTVLHPRYVRTVFETSLAMGTRESATIAVDGGGSITGVLRVGGKPLVNARVAVYESSSGAFLGQGLSRPDGSYEVQGLAPGPVGITVQWDGGMRRLYKKTTVEHGKTMELNADVPAGVVSLEGSVTAKGAIPQLAKVDVGVITATGEEQWQTATVSVTGKYEVDQLPQGMGTVRVYAIGQDSRVRRGQKTVELDTAGPRLLDVDLSGSATIAGTLSGLMKGSHARIFAMMGQDSRHHPTLEALKDMSDSAAKRVFTRDNGRFRLSSLEAGQYTVIAIALRDDKPTEVAGAPTAVAVVTVEENGRAEISLDFGNAEGL